MDFVNLWRCGRNTLPPPDSGASFSSFGVFVFDIWVLRFRSRVLRFRDLGVFVFDLGCFVFEFWVLRASVFAFECFVFETTRLRRRLQFLQNGDRLKLANFPDLYASRVSKIEGNTFSFRNNICLRQEPY